jgi:iduronate 2-sulfatase
MKAHQAQHSTISWGFLHMSVMRLLFCLLALVCVSPLVAAEKPNVLFIVADDLRTELGCYGSVAQTPHIDALAKRGVQFNHAYCQQAVCNPSRSSFLTGKRPDSLHLWVNGTHFRKHNPDVLTLPQYFKQEGYETRCCGKVFHNWHTDPKGDRPSWSADEFLHYANHGSDAPLVKGEQPPNEALEYAASTAMCPWPNAAMCRTTPTSMAASPVRRSRLWPK